MLPIGLPTTMPEFLARFSCEQNCRNHLFALRWPDGFRCKSCNGETYYELEARTNVYQCRQCDAQNSLLAGTVFEQTKSPLHKWFLAFHLFVSSKGGVSALELKRQMGFGSDQTAWTWLHKIRSSMDLRGEPLDGVVEVDETYIGGPKPGKPGRGAAGKTLAAGAVERRTREVVAPDPERFSGIVRTLAERVVKRLVEEGIVQLPCLGRARLAVVPDASAKSLEAFVKNVVAGGASVISDAWSGLGNLAQSGYGHVRINISRSAGEAHEYLPATHLVFALLKRVLLGTYHGGVGARHLPAYLDEFVFRFNRRSLAPALRTCAAIARTVDTPPYRNKEICGRTKRAT